MTDDDTVLAGIGPFCALDSLDEGTDWRPLGALRDGRAFDERVAYTADFLGRLAGVEIEPRVAASTMSLGLFARLLAPHLGAAALGIRLPALDWDLTWWRPSESGPWPLAATGTPVPPDPGKALVQNIFPLAEVIEERYSLSSQVVRGNAASAVFGAVRMIARARPELTESALGIGRSLLDGPLHGTGTVVNPAEVDFLRTSCCLYYRVPGGGYCGDCVLRG